MVAIVAATLRLMSECNTAALGRYKDYLGPVIEKCAVVVGKCGYECGRTDGAYCIHALLSRKGGLLKRLSCKIACCYYDDIQVGYLV
jgi:hypothetical protein